MTLRAYARVSTLDQVAGLDAQIRDLIAHGVEPAHIYQEQISSQAVERPQLRAALDAAQPHDTLIVTKLDRLARSTQNLLAIVAELEAKEVGLVILSMGGQQIDTRSPTGKLIITMFGALAAFERELMLERQKEGIARAKAQGKYKGRPRLELEKPRLVQELWRSGMSPRQIAEHTKLALPSVYRHLGRQLPAVSGPSEPM
jgi:DNA invertase Pin-like site-specific DNA recombinase